jgi:kynureninase
MRPVLTGWFAEFSELAAERSPGAVAYPRGGARFAGATYDPTSHYRAARVFGFFEERGLTPELLRQIYLHQTTLLGRLIDELDLPKALVSRDWETPAERFGGFLALRSPMAESVSRRLASDGVQTDSRGTYLRLGPAPYLCDEQLEEAVRRLRTAVLAEGGPRTIGRTVPGEEEESNGG